MMRQPRFMERRPRSGRVRHHSGRGGILVHVLCALLALSQASISFAQQMTEEEKEEQKELEKLIGKEKDIEFKTDSSDKGKGGFESVKGDPKGHDPGTDPKTQEMIRTYEDQVGTTPGTKLDRAATHRSSVHLEGEFKKQVARLGGNVQTDDIDQHLVFRPSEAAKTDPALISRLGAGLSDLYQHHRFRRYLSKLAPNEEDIAALVEEAEAMAVDLLAEDDDR